MPVTATTTNQALLFLDNAFQCIVTLAKSCSLFVHLGFGSVEARASIFHRVTQLRNTRFDLFALCEMLCALVLQFHLVGIQRSATKRQKKKKMRLA